MKSFYCKSILGLGVMAASLGFFSEANAENRLEISPDPIIISSYEPSTISIMLDNTDPVVALNFDIALPQGMKLDGSFVSSEDRVPATTVLDYVELGTNRYRVALVSFSNKPLKENEGAIITFDVKAEDGVLDDFSEGYMVLDAIQLAGSGSGNPGEIAPSYECNADFRAEVKFSQGTFEMTVPEEDYTYTSGETFTMSVGMDNSIAVKGIGFKIQVPEGFVIDEDSFKRVRLNSAALISTNFDATLGICVVEVLTINGQPVIEEEGTGTFLTFDVTAPESFDQLKSEVRFYECNVSVGDKNVSLDINDVESTLINEDIQTGVVSVATEGAAEYFSIDGKKLDGPSKGINIVRKGDKIYKVLVK